MRILYIADHSGKQNDDEGAIAFALAKLGHELIRVPETIKCADAMRRKCRTCDFLLFHNWSNVELMRQLEIPKVFWYFDLVSQTLDGCPKAFEVSKWRRKLLRTLTRYSDIGFCTDGDLVNDDTTDKLVRLTQGADERVCGYGKPRRSAPILFAGSTIWVKERQRQIAGLQHRYGSNLRIVSGEDSVYGRAYANLLTSAKVTIALDQPISDSYWSNRVYLTLGFGGFLIHPWSKKLAEDYAPATELEYYHTRDGLFALIDYHLEHSKDREELRRAGYERTMKSHLYRHRCETLLRTIKERGIV